MKKILFLLAALAAPFGLAQAQTDVDLELILVVDISGSIDGGEYNLQMDGYGAAFRSAAVQTGIAAGPLGKIAVNVVFFGTNAAEWTNGWKLIDSNATADAFASLIETIARPGNLGTSTSIGDGINAAYPLFASNDYDAQFQVIDVSGDGEHNVGSDQGPVGARANAVGAGVDTINGIVIGSGLKAYYDSDVITANGTTYIAQNFDTFGTAVEGKLVEEITNPGGNVVPEASEYGMMGAAALILLGLVRRLRK